MESKIISHFGQMKDPRIDRRKLHSLESIVFIAVAGVMCGCNSWDDIEDYGLAKKEWLSTFLDLSNGIPSHDTFNLFFKLLDPKEFEDSFLRWVHAIVDNMQDEFVSIDGKSIRGSRRGSFLKATHIVSAWANGNNLVLGQVKTEEKSNEITAIPELLEVLSIEGSIVTIDAMGTQKDIATKIAEKGAGYVLALKDNQKHLRNDVISSFSLLKPTSEFVDNSMGHGRIESRKCSVITNLQYIDKKEEWTNLSSVVRVESQRVIKSTGIVENETRYYISTELDAVKIGQAVRAHWGIENKLHWVLDVAMNEDDSAKRSGYSAQNFALLNKICLNLVKKNSRKIGVKRKRNIAGWDNEFLVELLKF